MVSKDQSIGGVICLVCVVVGVLYTLGLFYWGYWLDSTLYTHVAFTLIAIPVFIAFIAILGIGAWIGWTMATTPPPKPIEEITSEMETEQKTKVEEKPMMEEKPAVEEKPSEQSRVEEEKKPEKKRKT
jgi:1,4-dihydroxy-2-naphthoate octaprenyltransferase